MPLRVFVTGVSGYLGSVLAEHLARDGTVESITGIDLETPAAPLPAKVKYVRMDIRSRDLATAMAGHDVVIHTAFVVQWLARMPAAELDDINLNGTRNVARAAAAARVRRFVHASSNAVYDSHLVPGKSDVAEDFPLGKGDSRLYYWNGKAAAERTVRDTLAPCGVPVTCLRPCYIIGPRNRATVRGFRANVAKFRGRDPRTQFVHEEDVAAAFLQAMQGDMPGTYNVVPDDFIRLSGIWKTIGVESVRTVPISFARWMTAIRWRYLRSSTHPSWVDSALLDFTCSNARLRATGWAPCYGSVAALQTAL